jgi:hypothetical protein
LRDELCTEERDDDDSDDGDETFAAEMSDFT